MSSPTFYGVGIKEYWFNDGLHSFNLADSYYPEFLPSSISQNMGPCNQLCIGKYICPSPNTYKNVSCNLFSIPYSAHPTPICQSSECKTLNGSTCIFPFIYSGRKYANCITLGDVKQPWCSTNVDKFGKHIPGSEQLCNDSCSVTNCPLGYYKIASDDTCYKVSSVKSFAEMFFQLGFTPGCNNPQQEYGELF